MGLLSKAAAQPGRGSLLRKIQQKAERAALSSNFPDPVGRIDGFLKDFGPFRGMVLELPPGAEEKDFIPRIEKILSALGSVCFLSPRSCLVMVPDNIDSELLAHRLSKSLGVKALHHFRADTSGGAMEQLAPYR